MPSFAKIKYISDDQKCTVPLSHMKVIHNGLLKPDELETGDSYQVFWSPSDLDSPDSVEAAGNDVLDVDDMPAKEAEKLRKANGGNQLMGWYNALLLSLRDSDEDDRPVPIKRELSESNVIHDGKRLKIPSTKSLEAAANKAALKGLVPKKTGHKLSPKPAEVKAACGEANAHNLQKTIESAELMSKKSRKDKSKDKLKHKVKEKTKKEKNFDSAFRVSPSDEMLVDDSPIGDPKDNMIINQEQQKDDEAVKVRKNPDNVKPDKTSDNAESSSSSDSSSESDTMEVVMLPAKRSKEPQPGAKGDSAAVFELASSLWTPEELVMRSPTGLPGNKHKGAKPYPMLTPQKVQQCKALIETRIKEDSPSATSAEVRARTNATTYILGQKIQSVRKSSKTKGINIPTSEEAAEKVLTQRKEALKAKKGRKKKDKKDKVEERKKSNDDSTQE